MALRVLEIFKPDTSTLLELPLFLCRVPAGFPSPADDYLDETLDLNRKLISNKSATFIVRAQGDSMEGVGIFSGDLLVVDRSITPISGHIVVASLNGELTVKRYRLVARQASLVSENPRYAPILLNEEHDLVIWGVVAHSIHTFRAL